MAGKTGVMVALMREPGETYRVRTELVDVQRVMLEEKKLPDEFINERGNGVTQAFIDWCAPLIGEPLPRLVSLR